jgi:hypothetical protein
MGYRKFKVLADKLCDTRKMKKKYQNLSASEYSKLLGGLCSDITNSISKNHGVACYRDGNKNNVNDENIFFLHICDVLACIVGIGKGYIPEVIIKSSLLTEINQSPLINDFMSKHLSKDRFDFLMTHVDFVYMIFGYYSNNSYVPIRLGISKNSGVFKESSLFMNDPFFLEHQRGKMKEFNQNNKSIKSRVMYRSI